VSELGKDRSVVLISGSDGGIGSAIVRELSARGYRLSLGSLDVGSLTDKFGPETESMIHQPFDAFDAKSA
jgi:NADP-dependent 3-hydroxy acid dehydrogenase YdfG